ncbi:hypothetical protein NVP1063O_096 [Vibrio phage 1.063.O._10N.261.45.C7]|nr:hypothetical protein NVP1063O_096 [Vibrio phage 1.063.O._10N.261.45.C7]
MNTLLKAIKQHPDAFIYTLQSRASTTPSESNKRNHMLLAAHIAGENWGGVSEIIQKPRYRSGLEGVVICLNMDYDYSIKSKIIELFEEGKLV